MRDNIKYRQLQKEWRDIAIGQLSNANNILFTLSSGFFAIGIEKCRFRNIQINPHHSVDWSMILYLLFIISISFSIFCGLGLIVMRLYDFRISRQILFIRLRCYKYEKKIQLSENFNDIYSKKTTSIRLIYHILFKKLPFMSQEDIKILEIPVINKNFETLKSISIQLGQSTWILFKYQICTFATSIIFYLAYLITN